LGKGASLGFAWGYGCGCRYFVGNDREGDCCGTVRLGEEDIQEKVIIYKYYYRS
jgi:hypothetical protein